MSEKWQDKFIEKWDSGERGQSIIDTIIEVSFEQEFIDDGRGSDIVISRAEINDRFFQVKWNEPTSDYGTSEYPHKPIEVKEVTRVIIDYIIYYEPVD